MEGGARIGRERVEAAGVFASGAARGPQLPGDPKASARSRQRRDVRRRGWRRAAAVRTPQWAVTKCVFSAARGWGYLLSLGKDPWLKNTLFRLGSRLGAAAFAREGPAEPAARLPLQNTVLCIGSRLSDAVAQPEGPAATVEGAGGARLFSKIRAEIRVEVAWGLRPADGFPADPTPHAKPAAAFIARYVWSYVTEPAWAEGG